MGSERMEERGKSSEYLSRGFLQMFQTSLFVPLVRVVALRESFLRHLRGVTYQQSQLGQAFQGVYKAGRSVHTSRAMS